MKNLELIETNYFYRELSRRDLVQQKLNFMGGDDQVERLVHLIQTIRDQQATKISLLKYINKFMRLASLAV